MSATYFEVRHRLWDEPLRDGPWPPELAEAQWGQWFAAVLAANCRVPAAEWHFAVERVEGSPPVDADWRTELQPADVLYSVTLRDTWARVRQQFQLGPSPVDCAVPPQ